MAVSDVSIAQVGGQSNVKLHPYLITLVRWCVSCLWSTATVFLHRLVTTPLPPIAASKNTGKPATKPRQAGTDHLHPEPRVECVVLHTPDTHTLDVIFVHGLYGSLGNTWRQGEWRSKYKLDPTKILLRNHTTKPCNCSPKPEQMIYNNLQEIYTYETNLNEKVAFNQFNGCLKKILPNENSIITEKFYNDMIRLDVTNNYETQGQFVTDLFKNNCDKHCDSKKIKCHIEQKDTNCSYEDVNEIKCKSRNCKCDLNEKCDFNECKCKLNIKKSDAKCEIGCGCVCDDCYSPCWPKDWIKEDFPGARVISINYTSDPYLWRPLWVKGNKRLRLHERAEQMMEQLLQLGVGQRPIIWVGHSKGGLFIKQIYCEAYEAYLKLDKNVCDGQNIRNNNNEDQSDSQYNKNIDNNFENKYNNSNRYTDNYDIDIENMRESSNFMNEDFEYVACTKSYGTTMRSIDEMNKLRNNDNSGHNYLNADQNNEENMENQKEMDNNFNLINNSDEMCVCKEDEVLNNKVRLDGDTEYIDIRIRKDEQIRTVEDNTTEVKGEVHFEVMSSNNEEDSEELSRRAALWSQSSGFMFYSVPHRGSPLADIKTPITSRSVELLEIAKDCPLVLSLQARWLVATASSRPAVRSLVETCRTLMSVLWLRIVSVDSADAGVGCLHGVSVDHREICKPSSRRCVLYTELTDLIHGALSKCDCQ